MKVFGVVNAHMFGMIAESSEHVDWSSPDYLTESAFEEIGLGDPVSYAESSPHMIVFEAGEVLP